MKRKREGTLANREIEEILTKAGIAPTAQRIAIYRCLAREANHILTATRRRPR